MASFAIRLQGIDAKIVRAEEHLATLEHEADSYLRRDVAKFPVNLNRKDRTITVSFHLLIEPPIPLGVIVGDVTHNARSALDHLWGALTGTTSGGFPVFRSRDKWDADKAKTLSRVPAGAHALVESLQPCFGSQDGELIGFLNTLSNNDKHKVLNLTATHAKESHLALWSKNNPGERVEVNIGTFGAFKPNANIEFTELSDALMDGGMDVQIKGLLTIAFKEVPFDGRNAPDLLRAILVALKDRVIPQLRPFIKP